MVETDDKSEENQETNDETDNTTKLQERIWESEWMLRPCHMYKSEYKGCKSFRARFHQFYVYGEKLDCSQWKEDFENCKKWKKSEDEEAYNALVESEKKRRLDRLRPHVLNDVWTRRESPPADWDAPLPDWLVKRDGSTFLAAKREQIRAGKDNEFESYIPNACTIL